jgi:hypothetical protein
MNKLITIAALAGFASLSFGQGYVAFQNTSGTRITTNAIAIGGTSGLTSVTLGGEYYYALLVAPSTTTTIGASLAGWTFTGDIATNTTLIGRLVDPGVTDGTSVQIPGYAAGTSASFAVVGFSASLIGNPALTSMVGIDGTASATTYWNDVIGYWNGGDVWDGYDPAQTADLAFFGISGVATGIPLTTAGFTADVMGVSPSIEGFTLYTYIPEPGTFALCGLGAAALMIFRRRR